MRIACIGSRDISDETEKLLIEIGKFIAFKDWTIVSGNALGSDASYAKGANLVDPTKVWLHLPWPSYNSGLIVRGNVIRPHNPQDSILAEKHHPAYPNLSQGVKKLMDRNAGILLDSDAVLAVLNPKKMGGGGTGHGWRIAGALGIPRLDLNGQKLEDVFEFLEKYEKTISKR